MRLIRYLLAISLFISGIFCLIRFFIDGFNWPFLLAMMTGITLAYLIKPSSNKRQRRGQDRYDWLDWIDLPVDFLFQIISLPFRLIFRIFDSPSIDL